MCHPSWTRALNEAHRRSDLAQPLDVESLAGARDGGDAVVRGEAGDQTGPEPRGADPRAAGLTGADITIRT
ncbi:hypothetical protein [Microtetraspora malaysiensis]|uniref:hypothetical protein n=1 Tax=Microtetraspora malaysiensis TaxID=161358 RepID=UPI003D8EAB72